MPVHASLAIIRRGRLATTAAVAQLGTENQAAPLGPSRREYSQHLTVQRIPGARYGFRCVLEREVH